MYFLLSISLTLTVSNLHNPDRNSFISPKRFVYNFTEADQSQFPGHFQSLEHRLNNMIQNNLSSDSLWKTFKSSVLSIAADHIPIIVPRKTKHWLTNTTRNYINRHRRAHKTWRLHPTPTNHNYLHILNKLVKKHINADFSNYNY